MRISRYAGSMKNLKKPEAILFDWDGTLVDTVHVLLTGYNDVFDHFGMPKWNLDDAKTNIRTSSRETFPALFGTRADEALEVYYNSVEKNHLLHLGKMDGADDFLETLYQLGVPMGVISNKRDIYLKREIAHLSWGKYFSCIVGAGRAAKDKPAPDTLVLALNEMNLTTPNPELWYVGDTETDLEFAANTRMKKIFISHGFGTLENAEKYSPDLTVSSLGQLGKSLAGQYNLL